MLLWKHLTKLLLKKKIFGQVKSLRSASLNNLHCFFVNETSKPKSYAHKPNAKRYFIFMVVNIHSKMNKKNNKKKKRRNPLRQRFSMNKNQFKVLDWQKVDKSEQRCEHWSWASSGNWILRSTEPLLSPGHPRASLCRRRQRAGRPSPYCLIHEGAHSASP